MPEIQDVWTLRINALGDVLIKLITPLLVTINIYMQTQTRSALDEAKTVVSNKVDAAKKEAAIAKTEAKATSDTIEGIKLTQDQIAVIAQANLKQWKAYNTKAPEDMDEAHELTRAAESFMPPTIPETATAK